MPTPSGWQADGKAPHDYEFETDRAERRTGTASGVIRSRTGAPSSFASLTQVVLADDYVGKRLRFRAWLKMRDVGGRGCNLWMRIDRGSQHVAFGRSSPVTGSKDWHEHAVVLDVSSEAQQIPFGLVLDGPGAVWIADASFEVVGFDVPVTTPALPRAPRNLDFSE